VLEIFDALLLAQEEDIWRWIIIGAVGLAVMFALFIAAAFLKYGKLWVQAFMSNANVGLLDREDHGQTSGP